MCNKLIKNWISQQVVTWKSESVLQLSEVNYECTWFTICGLGYDYVPAIACVNVYMCNVL